MSSRLIFLVILCLSLVFLPYWATFILMLVGIVRFRHYYEALFPAYVMDTLFGVPLESFYSYTLIVTTVTLVLILIWGVVSSRMRSHSRFIHV
jgi:hypothetical protein